MTPAEVIEILAQAYLIGLGVGVLAMMAKGKG